MTEPDFPELFALSNRGLHGDKGAMNAFHERIHDGNVILQDAFKELAKEERRRKRKEMIGRIVSKVTGIRRGGRN